MRLTDDGVENCLKKFSAEGAGAKTLLLAVDCGSTAVEPPKNFASAGWT